jgi:hypothetical protein
MSSSGCGVAAALRCGYTKQQPAQRADETGQCRRELLGTLHLDMRELSAARRTVVGKEVVVRGHVRLATRALSYPQSAELPLKRAENGPPLLIPFAEDGRLLLKPLSAMLERGDRALIRKCL